MISVDSESFLTVVAVGAIAALVAGLIGPRLTIPVVVLEIVLGIVVGPELLGLADPDQFLEFFSSLGLGMLFFFAGYEIDFERIRGSPLRLGALGWVISLALAYSLGGLLSLTGLVLSLLFTGSALATTAIGTLIPILSDAGELRTRFGTYLLAAGAMGEFGPILLITFVFSTQSAVDNALILLAFVFVAVVAAVVAVRGVGRHWALFERTLETSGQLAVRIAVVAVFALAALASSLGLDLLLGGFVAGVIVRIALRGREVTIFESKLTAVGYGFFIPFFFVVSGVNFDLSALTDDPVRLLELPLFLALFLVVRGTPALLLYRGVLDARARWALVFFSSTELPLVVAITTIAIDQNHMRPSTAASLVGAAILSTLIFPLIGLRLRAGEGEREGEPSPASK
jgi:Kef-type K+ transport system membrane component KefB